MERTIIIYGSDTDTTYSNYRLIKTEHVEALSGVESKTINVLDVFTQEEIVGENIEYINGELSNAVHTRRKFEIICDKFVYSTVTNDAYYDKMSVQDLYNLQFVLRKKYLWADFSDYENKSGASIYSGGSGSALLIPIVQTERKMGKDNKIGVRTCDFTFRHRWNNDLTLGVQI